MAKFQGKLILSGSFCAWTAISIPKSKSMGKTIPALVVRNPITNEPFIPASSIRGAVKKSMEKRLGTSPESPICQIFGESPRATFRDACLTASSRENLAKLVCHACYTEIRTSARVDRITCQGVSYAVEEVPAGSHFGLEILFNIHAKEDVSHFKLFLQGLQDLEEDSLGSHKSRGLGKIKFGSWNDESVQEQGISLVWRSRQHYTEGVEDLWLVGPEQKASPLQLIAVCDQIAKVAEEGETT